MTVAGGIFFLKLDTGPRGLLLKLVEPLLFSVLNMYPTMMIVQCLVNDGVCEVSDMS